MLERFEHERKSVVDKAAREAEWRIARGSAFVHLAGGAPFRQKLVGGHYTADGYQRHWCFGMKMGQEKLAP